MVAVPPSSIDDGMSTSVTSLRSLSVVITGTSGGGGRSATPSDVTLLKLLSVLDAVIATSQLTSPSLMLSSSPVTVTICAVFQFILVKVSELGDTVPFRSRPRVVYAVLATVSITSAAGCLVSSTVKGALLPSPTSVTVRPPANTTGTFSQYSLSVLTAYTVTAETASYLASPVAIWFTVRVTW